MKLERPHEIRAELAAALLCLALPTSGLAAGGDWTEGVACRTDASQTYTVYRPSGFESGRRWPVILVFDPRGRSRMAAELFVAGADELGWLVLSSNDTRSDGPMDPNIRAINALWGELGTVHRIDPKRIYATGFSGGAMLAWDVGRQTGELAGVIGVGGRLEPHNLDHRIEFPCFGAVGTTDFNYLEMKLVHEKLREWNAPERLEIFPGPHAWLPPEIAHLGMVWLELQAMERGLREVDTELAERWYEVDLEHARRLEADGHPHAASRRFRAAVETFDGVLLAAELATAARESDRLGSSKAVAAEIANETKWDRFDRGYRRRMTRALGRIEIEPEVSSARLVAELRLEHLHRRADDAGSGYEGIVADRLLNIVATQGGFYLARGYRSQGNEEALVKSLAVATAARPDRWWLWHAYAGALARSGSRKKALEALELAIDAGYSDFAALETDPDFERVRSLDGYRTLIAED